MVQTQYFESFNHCELQDRSTFDLVLILQNCCFASKNGESSDDIYNRVVDFLKNLRNQSVRIDEKIPNILIVAHAGSIHDLIPAMFAEIKTKVPENLNVKNGLRKNTAYVKMKMEISINDFAVTSVECEGTFYTAHLANLDNLESSFQSTYKHSKISK